MPISHRWFETTIKKCLEKIIQDINKIIKKWDK
jgi:hypothetical protein